MKRDAEAAAEGEPGKKTKAEEAAEDTAEDKAEAEAENEDEAEKAQDEEEEEEEDDDDDDEKDELKFAVVCSSNMNRSMEAHKQFMENGLDVVSFGVGNMVRLPSPQGAPLSFDFDKTYAEMKNEIISRGELQWYRDRGLLDMLDRNIDIKEHPERFQDYADVAQFNIVFCFEERVYDILVKDLESREAKEYKCMHVLNLDVKDDTGEAKKGAEIALVLCKKCVERKDDLEEALPELIKEIESQYSRPITHKTHFL